MADKSMEKKIPPPNIESVKEPKLLFTDWLGKWNKETKGVLNGGEAICQQPSDQQIMINPTTPIGHGNLLYAKIVFTMPKYHYNLLKVDEYMIVSPAYPEMYGRIVAKKKELEGQIKSGLASASQAVADFELLRHDERKYKEIMDYFKEGQKEEHVLRSLFIDRVDAHTGEGYSMVSMTKRWPTIITDFLRMSNLESEERKDTKKIREKLEISEAEATVLKTKNNVFEEWKVVFFPDVKDRYARIRNLVDARVKSIDEYRSWLMPHVVNMKMFKDMTEVEPSAIFTSAVFPWQKPNAMYGVRIWLWKSFTPEEVGKPGLVEGEIKPYDDFVKRNCRAIEDQYNVRIVEKKSQADKLKKKELLTDDDIIVIEEKLEKWQKPDQTYEKGPALDPYRHFYAFYDLDIVSPLLKLEGGKEEVDDWNCLVTPYLVTQNVIMLALLEIEAKNKWLDRYVKSLIGVREVEDKYRKHVEEEYGIKEEEKKGRLDRIRAPLSSANEKRSSAMKAFDNWWLYFKPKLRQPLKYFMRIGPYETVRSERLSKMYGRYMGGAFSDPMIKFIKTEIGKLSGVQPP